MNDVVTALAVRARAQLGLRPLPVNLHPSIHGLVLPDGRLHLLTPQASLVDQWAQVQADAPLSGPVPPIVGAHGEVLTSSDQGRLDQLRLSVDEISSRWASKGRFRYDASQALADISAGTANILPKDVVNELRARGDAPRATAALGRLMIDGALAGHEHLPRYPQVHGNSVRLLRGNSEFLPQLFHDVEHAQDHINIIQFNWEPDGGGEELANLLKARKAANPKLDINVYVDAYGIAQGGVRRHYRFFKDLEDAGINVKRNWRFGIGRYAHAWEHRKLYEIDSAISYVGGLGLGRKYDTWTDLMVRMEGPVSAQSATQLIGSWSNRGGEVDPWDINTLLDISQGPLKGTANPPLVGEAGPTDAVHSVQLLMNRPRVDMAASEQFLRDAAAAGAGDRLWITTPYIGGEEIAGPLREAAQRGADVRVVVPGFESGRNIKLLRVSRTFYKDLIDSGVQVRELPAMLHAKAWLTNDIANAGSMNLSMNSFKGATEIVARVKGEPFYHQMERFFLDTEAAARPVPMEELTTSGMRLLTTMRKFLRVSF